MLFLHTVLGTPGEVNVDIKSHINPSLTKKYYFTIYNSISVREKIADSSVKPKKNTEKNENVADAH